MIRICRALVGLFALALVVTAVGAAWRPEPVLRGTDEIYYLDIRGLNLQPGEAWGEDLPIQHPDLSVISFPYRVDGGRPAQIRLRVETADGRAIADRLLTLAPTPSIDSRSVWFQATFWGPVARYEEMAITGAPDAGALKLSFYVLPGSPPVALFWDFIDPVTGTAGRYPLGVGPESITTKRVGVATGYGRLTPAPLRLGTYETRVARLSPPWLPQPLPALLLVAGLVLAGGLVRSLATSGPRPGEDAGAEGWDAQP